MNRISLDVFEEEILPFKHYHEIEWEESKEDGDIKQGRIMLEKMGFTNYIDYIYHQMGFEEIFDLPDIMLDKIIEKIPLEGISKYLKLSENRINKYKNYLNGHLLGFNKSLTRELYKKFKTKIDAGSYLSHTNIDIKTVQYILDKTDKEIDKLDAAIIRGENVDIKDLYKNIYVMRNPKVIPMIKDLKIPEISEVYQQLGLNPDINEDIQKYLGDGLDDYLISACQNPRTPVEYIEVILETLQEIGWYTSEYLSLILSTHIQTPEFMKYYSNEYLEDQRSYFSNPCTKVTKEMLLEFKDAPIFYKSNPLCRYSLLSQFITKDEIWLRSSAMTIENYKNSNKKPIQYYTRATYEILKKSGRWPPGTEEPKWMF